MIFEEAEGGKRKLLMFYEGAEDKEGFRCYMRKRRAWKGKLQMF